MAAESAESRRAIGRLRKTSKRPWDTASGFERFDAVLEFVLQVSMPSHDLAMLYPPSEPCRCAVCLNYCTRPGWWTVEEADGAISLGYGTRMMLEVAPELTFGVLSPAFKGGETRFALQEYSANKCTFLRDGLCGLFGTGVQPLECRFCHHDRVGLGPQCHADIEKDWNTTAGQALVKRWIETVRFQWSEYYYGLVSRGAR